MQKSLLLKAAAVLLLALLLLIPLSLIQGLVSERQARSEQVVSEVAASYAGAQQITGPVLVLPYTEEYRETVATDAERPAREVWRRQTRQLFLFPDTLDANGKLDTNVKRRGLFSARVFELQSTLSGRFVVPAELPYPRRDKDSRITPGQAWIALGISDARGLSGSPQIVWDGHPLTLAQGTRIPALPDGVHAEVALPGDGSRTLAYSVQLTLLGTEQLSVVPLARYNQVELQSAWPHPSFGGRFLPDPQTQTVNDKGFTARWHIASLATRAQAQLAETSAETRCAPGCLDRLELRLIDPVNIYSLSDRALKYDTLFVALTFAAFFLFEVLKQTPVHPAQYALVGLALAVFFLLLLALSEHIAFGAAYAIAALACVGLVSFYLSGALGGRLRGLGFGAMLGALYAALFGLLISEDNALLMGSLLMFGLLATAMVVTRRLDWYRSSPAPQG